MSERWAGWRRVAVGAALVALWVVSAGLAPPPARLAERASPVVAWADGTTAWMGLAPDGRRRVSLDLDRLDPDYVPLLLALEDPASGGIRASTRSRW